MPQAFLSACQKMFVKVVAATMPLALAATATIIVSIAAVAAAVAAAGATRWKQCVCNNCYALWRQAKRAIRHMLQLHPPQSQLQSCGVNYMSWHCKCSNWWKVEQGRGHALSPKRTRRPPGATLMCQQSYLVLGACLLVAPAASFLWRAAPILRFFLALSQLRNGGGRK